MATELNILPKSAQLVQDALTQKGFSLDVVELSSSTRTANDAAKSLGCTTGQIVKSLLFKTVKSSMPVLILASGPNRVNEKVIEHHLGEALKKADAKFTRDITGFAIGGIPPLGHKNKIDHIFIDEDLLAFDKVWAAAGTPNTVFSFNARDIESLTDGVVISIN